MGWRDRHDARLVEILGRPMFLSVLLCASHWGIQQLQLPVGLADPIAGLLWTMAIVTWAVAAARIGGLMINAAAAHERTGSVLQPRTQAIFDIFCRFTVAGIAVYFMFLIWGIDLTAWLASAGIVGIAFIFATRDAFADTFAGVLIIAYGPYELHDWIVVDNKVRGEVIHIGLRTTRLLTTDDVEVLIRNGLITKRKITNESRGRHRRQRVRIPFEVGYGTDVEQLRALILAASRGAPNILEQPEDAAPTLRLRQLGPRGLELELSVWIDDPRVREPVIDEMLTRIHAALSEASIEIPIKKARVRVR